MLGEKLPPHDLDAETSVLGSIIIDGDSLTKVSSFLHPEDFYSKANSVCFDACLSLFDRGTPIDEKTLGDFLESEDLLKEIEGGRGYFSYMVSQVPTHLHIEFYGKIVQRTATMRRLIGAANEIASIGYNDNPDLSQALGQAEEIIFGLRTTQDSKDFTPLRESLDTYLLPQDLVEGEDNNRTPIPSGFRDLDQLLGGLQRSDMLVLAARPSIGKSTLALNIARHAAGNNQKVAIFSLEMGREQIALRLLSSESRIDTHRLRLGLTTNEQDAIIVDSVGRLSDLPIWIDDTPIQTVIEMRSKARRLQKERGLDFIVVDYMQLIYGSRGNRDNNRAQEVSAISRELKAMARDLHVPVLAVSQLSRSIEQRQSHRPILSDLRESGSIEQDSDIVAFIHREEKFTTEEEWIRANNTEPYPKGLAEIIIAKHRHGPIGSVWLVVNDNFATFNDAARGIVSS
ncbi:MAG: replicative DNA helicase [Chloroflexi bacterium]|nr:replicative DNA helicase [Chloroflexota bacterium]|tara:strand:- start:698 stop:2068 length:1371 start_codon:yes stop_codon:yes gene_type:complete